MQSLKLHLTIIVIILLFGSFTVITSQQGKAMNINTWFMAPMLQKRNTDMKIKKSFFLYPFVYPYYYYSQVQTTTPQPSYFWGRTPSTAQPSYFWGVTPPR